MFGLKRALLPLGNESDAKRWDGTFTMKIEIA
jgi:hypothetical protein